METQLPTSQWDNQSEFIATVIDPCASNRWIVELGAGRQLVASISGAFEGDDSRLAPGDFVRIRFRSGRKTPRIVGYSAVDRQGKPTCSNKAR